MHFHIVLFTCIYCLSKLLRHSSLTFRLTAWPRISTIWYLLHTNYPYVLEAWGLAGVIYLISIGYMAGIWGAARHLYIHLYIYIFMPFPHPSCTQYIYVPYGKLHSTHYTWGHDRELQVRISALQKYSTSNPFYKTFKVVYLRCAEHFYIVDVHVLYVTYVEYL